MNNSNNVYGKLCNAGVDWFSFTMLPNASGLGAITERFEQLQGEALAAGDGWYEAGDNGYKGYKTKHLFYGERHDGSFFRASGDIAQQVAVELKTSGVLIKPTRIDVQVTVLADRKWVRFASAMRTMVRKHQRRTGAKDRSAIRLWEFPGKGDTCKLGSPDSTRQFIGYDKTAEQKGKLDGQQYRFELKLTDQQAREVWPVLKNAADMRWIAMSYVGGFLICPRNI